MVTRPVQAPIIMAQTRGVNLSEEVTHRIFSDHISMSHCRPNELFKLNRISTTGSTSEWAVLKKEFALLNDLIEASGGLIPHQKSTHSHLVTWLATNSMTWALKDSERATNHLRVALQSLLGLKRSGSGAPKKFPELQIIIDKLILPSSTKDDVNMSAVVPTVPVPFASTQAMVPVPVASTHAMVPVPVATQAMVPIDDDSDFGEEFQSKLFNVYQNPEPPTPKPKPMLDPNTEFFPPSMQRWITPASTPMSTPVRSNLMMHTSTTEKHTTEKHASTTPGLLNADELRRLSFQGPPIKAPLPGDYNKFGKAEESDADVDETVKRHRLHEKTDGDGKKCLAFPKPEIKKKKDKIVTKKKDKTVPEDLHPMVLE